MREAPTNRRKHRCMTNKFSTNSAQDKFSKIFLPSRTSLLPCRRGRDCSDGDLGMAPSLPPNGLDSGLKFPLWACRAGGNVLFPTLRPGGGKPSVPHIPPHRPRDTGPGRQAGGVFVGLEQSATLGHIFFLIFLL